MNGIDFLADTNALIYLLNGDSCMFPYLEKNLAISIILPGLQHTDALLRLRIYTLPVLSGARYIRHHLKTAI